jgi:hypothetical protein
MFGVSSISGVFFYHNDNPMAPIAFYNPSGATGTWEHFSVMASKKMSIHLPNWSHLIVIIHEVSHHIHMNKRFSRGEDDGLDHGKTFMSIEQELFSTLLRKQQNV